MFFTQIKQSGDNFSYVLADETTNQAAVVDPSFNTDAVARQLDELKFKLKYIINTHHHRDHTAGNDNLKSRYGAKVVAHKLSQVKKDISVVDGDTIELGHISIRVIHTPGHTPDGICLLADSKLITGDTLFVGECGRTDIPGASAKDMYDSLFHKLMKLNDQVEVYPGHDYGSKPFSTIGFERRNNYTLKERTLSDFIEFMSEP